MTIILHHCKRIYMYLMVGSSNSCCREIIAWCNNFDHQSRSRRSTRRITFDQQDHSTREMGDSSGRKAAITAASTLNISSHQPQDLLQQLLRLLFRYIMTTIQRSSSHQYLILAILLPNVDSVPHLLNHPFPTPQHHHTLDLQSPTRGAVRSIMLQVNSRSSSIIFASLFVPHV